MTEERKRKLALDIFLAFHRVDQASHFSAQLFRLMHKADPTNRARFAGGFPLHYEVYTEWAASPNEADFYDKYGVRHNLAGDEENAILTEIENDWKRGGRSEGEGAERILEFPRWGFANRDSDEGGNW